MSEIGGGSDTLPQSWTLTVSLPLSVRNVPWKPELLLAWRVLEPDA